MSNLEDDAEYQAALDAAARPTVPTRGQQRLRELGAVPRLDDGTQFAGKVIVVDTDSSGAATAESPVTAGPRVAEAPGPLPHSSEVGGREFEVEAFVLYVSGMAVRVFSGGAVWSHYLKGDDDQDEVYDALLRALMRAASENPEYYQSSPRIHGGWLGY